MTPWAGPRVLFDGQSLNYSPVSGVGTYPTQTMTPLRNLWWTIGSSGKSWSVLQAGGAGVAPLADRLAPHVASGQEVVLVLCGGQSDILAPESQTGAAAFADLISYTTQAKAAGVDKIIVTTMTPMSTAFAGFSTTQQISDYNVLVRAGHPTIDAIVDLAVVPALADITNTTYYHADGVHWLVPGATVAADTVRPVLQSVIASMAA